MKYFLFLCIVITSSSCSPTSIVLSPKGTFADLTISGGTMKHCELLSLQQDSFFVMFRDSLVVLHRSEVRSIDLNLQHNLTWQIPVAILQGIPAVIGLGLIFGGATAPIGIPLLLNFGISLWSFIASEPTTSYRMPLSQDAVENLRLYARYPFGLNALRMEQLREGK